VSGLRDENGFSKNDELQLNHDEGVVDHSHRGHIESKKVNLDHNLVLQNEAESLFQSVFSEASDGLESKLLKDLGISYEDGEECSDVPLNF
jgi:dUTPase